MYANGLGVYNLDVYVDINCVHVDINNVHMHAVLRYTYSPPISHAHSELLDMGSKSSVHFGVTFVYTPVQICVHNPVSGL